MVWPLHKKLFTNVEKISKQSCLLKLDFEKADDKVEWDFIIEIIRNMGFGPKWINWILIWLHSTKIFVLANGEPGKEIVCKRGLRQGDPLSPLLFVLVAEGLNSLFTYMKRACKIDGLSVARSIIYTNL